MVVKKTTILQETNCGGKGRREGERGISSVVVVAKKPTRGELTLQCADKNILVC